LIRKGKTAKAGEHTERPAEVTEDTSLCIEKTATTIRRGKTPWENPSEKRARSFREQGTKPSLIKEEGNGESKKEKKKKTNLTERSTPKKSWKR